MHTPKRLRVSLAMVAVLLTSATATATGQPASPLAAEPRAPFGTLGAFPVVNGTYLPIAGNFDCDTGSDGFGFEEPGIVWYAAGSAPDYLWTDLVITDGVLAKTQTSLSVSGTYVPIVGDFDADRCDDIFWYGEGSSPDYLWWGGPSGFTSGVPVSVSGSYRPVASGKFIVWYAPLGTESMWEGTTSRAAPFVVRSFPQVSGSSYEPVVFYDAATGGPDILWYTPGTGGDSVWHFGDLTFPESHQVLAVSISGTYRTTTWSAWVVLHGPGFAVDQRLTALGNALSFSPLTIEGTYVVGGNHRVLVWHGPGTAPDQVWLLPPIGA